LRVAANPRFAVAATLILLISVAALNALAGSAPKPAREKGTAMALSVSSPSFSSGGDIPKKFTCDGADVSPQLSWTEPPAGTRSFALLVDDPDAPVGTWNHWTTWNLPASARGLAEGVKKEVTLPDGAEQGKNDFHKNGYNGPCPPPGKPHRYHFKLFALDTKLDLKPGAGKSELESAMKGHILAQAEWMGRYGR
jgi:Raf kinase inhibitor-like YbhB/YbcL family protein